MGSGIVYRLPTSPLLDNSESECDTLIRDKERPSRRTWIDWRPWSTISAVNSQLMITCLTGVGRVHEVCIETI